MHPPLNYLPERLEIRDPSQLSKDIVNRLTAFGYKVDDIFRAFNETTDYSKPEAIRSTYFLLVEMLQREETRMKAERRRSLAMALEAGKRLQPKFHSANSLDEASRDSTAVSSQISLSIGNDSCRRVNQPIGETKYQSETALLDTAQRIGPLSTKEVHAPQRRYESMQAISCETEYCIEKGLPPTAIQRPAAALTAKFSPSRPCRPQTSAPNGNWTAQRQIPQTYRQGEKDGFQFDESDSMDVSCATLSESMADLTTGAGVTNGGLKPIVDVERPSTAMANMIRASKDYSPGPGADDLRSVSGWFLNISATSTKTPKQIIIEILRVLTECRVPYVHDDKFTIVCEVDAGVVLGGTSPDYGELVEKGGVSKANLISFQIEVCRIPKMGMFGLHFKRISGGVWNYKKCCNRLLSLMSL
ncbi:hypothetical protein DFJ73DRAFT_162190 [Zopfochytrium polystomum]|nr:hypothetical protein DFJ73DRAFT_162190 [Zopfochytrium polystomum]